MYKDELILLVYFFFFKQKTAYEMRISDWSSDVCSSDLLEALGEAIKPYLQDSPAGAHVMCKEIDTGGALIEMSLEGMTSDGATVQLDLMVPGSMVRMIRSEERR